MEFQHLHKIQDKEKRWGNISCECLSNHAYPPYRRVPILKEPFFLTKVHWNLA